MKPRNPLHQKIGQGSHSQATLKDYLKEQAFVKAWTANARWVSMS
jgi:hypothetical protein